MRQMLYPVLAESLAAATREYPCTPFGRPDLLTLLNWELRGRLLWRTHDQILAMIPGPLAVV